MMNAVVFPKAMDGNSYLEPEDKVASVEGKRDYMKTWLFTSS